MKQQAIHTVLLGYGFSGSIFFAPFLSLHEGFLLKGAWERSKRRIQADYPSAHSYGSLEEVLDDETVELVVVNTPIDTHYAYAKKALEAGKHVIVEKTFTNTAEEAAELYELASAKGLQLFVFQNRRYDSDFLTARKLLESGRLGKLVEATISYDIHHPHLRGDGLAHTELSNSGGEFNNRGSHITDQALVLFGLPQAVFADFSTFRSGGRVEDYVEVILYYSDKRVKLRLTDISVQSQDAYVFHGTEGSFFKSRSDMQEARMLDGLRPSASSWCAEPADEEGVLYYFRDGEKVKSVIATEDGNYYNYFDAVYQAMRHGAPAPVTGLDGYRTMLVMDAARRSVAEKRIIPIVQ